MKDDFINKFDKHMIEKIQNDKFNNFDEKESLEFLLSILNLDIDEKVLAENLMKKFKTFAKIVDAPMEDILNCKNVTSQIAILLKYTAHLSRTYLASLNSSKSKIYNIETAYQMLYPKFIGKQQENVAVILLNSSGVIVLDKLIWEGTVSKVPIYSRELIKLCINYDADSIIIAHNHPSENPLPSKGDLAATRELQFALDSIYVYLQDHLIITNEHYLSMRNSGWMSDINQKMTEFKQSMIMDANRIDLEYGFEE